MTDGKGSIAATRADEKNQARLQQSQSHSHFHRVPPAVRRPDASRDAAIRSIGCVVFVSGVDRHQCLRLHGFAHASLVCRTARQTDFQSLLRRAVVGGGFGVADGAAGLMMALLDTLDEQFSAQAV